MLNRNPEISFILAGLDICCSAAAFHGAYAIRCSSFFSVDPYLLNYEQYNNLFIFVLLISFFSFYLLDSYTTENYADSYSALKGCTAVLFITMAFSFIYKQYDYSRLVLLFFYLFFCIFSVMLRFFIHRIEQHFYRRGIHLSRASVVGDTIFSDYITAENGYEYIIFSGNADTGTITEFIRQNKLDELFIDAGCVPFSELLKIRLCCDECGCTVSLLPKMENILSSSSQICTLQGIIFLRLRQFKKNRVYYFLKRLFDIVFSSTVIVLCGPVLLLSCALILLLYQVNPVFIQERIGKNGRKFRIYKIRTLYPDSPEYDHTPRIEMENEERIYPFGKFLRRFCIDELPQFFNVLKGDMSVVGPRPEMEFIVEKYTDIERRRLEILPGITGMWQIYGRNDGSAIHENIKYDLYYIENQSFALDIEIIVKTVVYVLFKAV